MYTVFIALCVSLYSCPQNSNSETHAKVRINNICSRHFRATDKTKLILLQSWLSKFQTPPLPESVSCAGCIYFTHSGPGAVPFPSVNAINVNDSLLSPEATPHNTIIPSGNEEKEEGRNLYVRNNFWFVVN